MRCPYAILVGWEKGSAVASKIGSKGKLVVLCLKPTLGKVLRLFHWVTVCVSSQRPCFGGTGSKRDERDERRAEVEKERRDGAVGETFFFFFFFFFF